MRAGILAGGIGALALAALTLALCAPGSAATVSVNIVDYAFSPQNITIQVGDTVNWTNTGTVGHDVHFEVGFGSGATGGIAPGSSWEHMFMAPGVYKYHCVEHSPAGFDPPNTMIGRVTVLDTANGPSAAFTSSPSGPVGPNATLAFAGLSADNSSVTAVAWQVDGGAVQPLAFTPAYDNDSRVVTWSFNVSASSLGLGNHTLTAWASNATANGTGATTTVQVLAAPPPPPAATPVSPPASWEVDIVSITSGFSPSSLDIATGDTITFVNHDTTSGHDVTFEAGFSSGAAGGLANGQNWSHTFDTAGTYLFHCQLHNPTSFTSGLMTGRVTVFDRALRPAVNVTGAPPPRVSPGATFTVQGTAADLSGVTGVFIQVDGGAPTALNFTDAVAGDARNVTWNATLGPLLPGTHTVRVFSGNGAHNSTVYSINLVVAAPPTSGGPPSGNPFGESFIFEDILTKYFWLITGVSIILIAVLMMFLSYSGKLQNYYIVLLTALDERHRFFAFARPTREFLYTIQRQMPRTHTERYNLKVIWYWYPLYCLGGLSFAAFIIETITGIILGFYYIPEGTGPNEGLPSAAYHSMETIMTKVTFGYIFRALHHWGAHMMVAAVFLHMMRVYFVGAYKNPRELNWLLGVILLNVTLGFGYTGYLLPWDQLSFWAGQIGLEMANTIPVIGEILGNMVFGGPELSGATIIRMYYLHVFILPLVGGALMVLHMGIVWMQGVAEPH